MFLRYQYSQELAEMMVTKSTEEEKTGRSSVTLVFRNKDFFPSATVSLELYYFGCMSQYLNQFLEGRKKE